MSYAMWTSGSLSGTAGSSSVSFSLTGDAIEGTFGTGVLKKTWVFYLFKNGSNTNISIDGFTVNSNWQASFSSKTFSYTLGSGDYSSSITFSVVGYCTVETRNSGTYTETTTDNPSCTVNTPAPPQPPSVTWNSGASITATPNNNTLTVTVTRSGGATLNNASGTVYYRLWCGSTRENLESDSGSSWTFSPTSYDTELTYYLEAYAVVNSQEYKTSYKLSAKATVISGNYVDYYNGSSWVKCKAYYYNGSSWVECKPYYYNGSSWIECSDGS